MNDINYFDQTLHNASLSIGDALVQTKDHFVFKWRQCMIFFKRKLNNVCYSLDSIKQSLGQCWEMVRVVGNTSLLAC